VDDAARKVGTSEKDVHSRAAMQAARVVLGRLLDTAEEISLRGYRLAGMDELQTSAQSS
jgi:hypothetical protein